MYGMINRGLQEMVLARHGPEVWKAICEKAGAKDATFVRMDTYPDSVTYGMVGAAAEILQVPAGDLLRLFGQFWIEYASGAGYGAMLDETGDNLFDMLENLDDLHFRLGHVFQLYGNQNKGFDKMVPPQFSVSERSTNRVIVHYRSKRDGLGPMVVGLIEGLATRCNQTARVIQTTHKGVNSDHDSFEVVLV